MEILEPNLSMPTLQASTRSVPIRFQSEFPDLPPLVREWVSGTSQVPSNTPVVYLWTAVLLAPQPVSLRAILVQLLVTTGVQHSVAAILLLHFLERLLQCPLFLGHDREDHRYGLNRSCFASGRVRCVNSLNTVHLLPARASFKARFTGRSPRKYAHLSSLAVSLLYWLGGLTGLPRSWDTTLIHLN